MRMSMRRFTRLTNGFSKKLDNDKAAIALYAMWYNFARIHQTLRVTPRWKRDLGPRLERGGNCAARRVAGRQVYSPAAMIRLMMNRRRFLRTLSASLLAAPLAADAQQAGKVPRIGFLSLTSPSDRPPLLDAFRQRLRELGWVEGQNIVIDYRYAEDRVDRLPDLAAELVRLKVDLIVSWGTQGVTAAKNATETIPIVMIAVRDPVGTGLIASLARPGGNVTGVSG